MQQERSVVHRQTLIATAVVLLIAMQNNLFVNAAVTMEALTAEYAPATNVTGEAVETRGASASPHANRSKRLGSLLQI